MRLRRFFFSTLLLATACGEPTGLSVTGSDRLDVTRALDGFLVENRTELPLAILAMDQNTLAVALIALCSTPTPDCLNLPSRETKLIPFGEIYGYTKNAAITIISWQVTLVNGEYQATAVEYTVVKQ